MKLCFKHNAALFRPVFLMLCSLWVSAAGAVASTPDGNELRLSSPQDLQVFQRADRFRGSIIIAGNAPVKSVAAQYRLTGKPLKGEVPPDWQPLSINAATHAFSQTISAPAGGWYRLEVQVHGPDGAHATAAVDHVGVGEVFVVAGQSNATNYGAARQKPASNLVVSFNGKTWRVADDPQPGTQDGSTGGSFIPAFGDALVDRFHVPVGIASTGCGATSVRQWLPKGTAIQVHPTLDGFVETIGPGRWVCTGQLYDGLILRIRSLGPHGFRALLWHQGESDAGQARSGYPADRQITGAQYRTLLNQLIQDSRRDAGWNFPWFIAQATYHSEADSHDEEFRTAQKSLWDGKLIQPGPDTDALGGNLRAGVHFNAQGQIAHGRLWAQKVNDYLDVVLSKPEATK